MPARFVHTLLLRRAVPDDGLSLNDPMGRERVEFESVMVIS